MDSLISVHDFLLDSESAGDWDGEEEHVIDTVNTVLHYLWDQLPQELANNEVEAIMLGLWDEIRGQISLLELDQDDILHWATQYLEDKINSMEH